MISLEDAISRILDAVQPLPSCRVALPDAVGRFCASEVKSLIDLPRFDNSAMDGYAVRSDDLKTASGQSPVFLECQFRIAAGEHATESIKTGTCARVFTGSPVPPGADAVVMQEDVTANGSQITFTEPVKPFENVRLRGEDIRTDEALFADGHRLGSGALALLAATGHGEVAVRKRCSISLLATGNELREAGETLRPGEIYESNRVMIGTLLEQLGAQSQRHSPVRDEMEQTMRALEKAFAESDAAITCGGVSVGEFDFVKEAFSKLGGTVDLWRIAIRPGKPFVFGKYRGKFLFGLPGNPVSAFVTFLLLVRPAILKMQGARDLNLPAIPGKLTERVTNRGDRRHFVRMRWENGNIRPVGAQNSHVISPLAQANSLLDLPPGATIEAGITANVLLWEWPV